MIDSHAPNRPKLHSCATCGYRPDRTKVDKAPSLRNKTDALTSREHRIAYALVETLSACEVEESCALVTSLRQIKDSRLSAFSLRNSVAFI